LRYSSPFIVIVIVNSHKCLHVIVKVYLKNYKMLSFLDLKQKKRGKLIVFNYNKHLLSNFNLFVINFALDSLFISILQLSAMRFFLEGFSTFEFYSITLWSPRIFSISVISILGIDPYETCRLIAGKGRALSYFVLS